MLRFSEYDLGQLENIMRALRNGSFTLTGLEALAFADCMKWASKLQESIKSELAEAVTKQKLESATVSNPFKESPIKTSEPVAESQPSAKKKK